MSAKKTSIQASRPHTFEAKHKILRHYAGAWLSILLRADFPEQLTIADCFAGPGVYPGGNPGSPVIILEEIVNALRGQAPRVPIEVICIEAQEKHFASLSPILGSWEPKLPPGVNLTPRQGFCQQATIPLLQERGALGPRRPFLAVLDAEGFQVPFPLVHRIAANPSSEVLITLMTGRAVQFAAKPDPNADDMFGDGGTWRKVADEPPHRKHEFVVDYYEKRLLTLFKHVMTFEITEETGYPLHLFFGTNHLKGFQAMKRPYWKADPVAGSRFRDPNDPNQLGLGLALNADLVPVKALIRDHLSDGDWHSVAAIKRRLWITRYEDHHVSKALNEMLERNEIERQGGTKKLSGEVEVRLVPSLFS